jgi:hypothetical protein
MPSIFFSYYAIKAEELLSCPAVLTGFTLYDSYEFLLPSVVVFYCGVLTSFGSDENSLMTY